MARAVDWLGPAGGGRAAASAARDGWRRNGAPCRARTPGWLYEGRNFTVRPCLVKTSFIRRCMDEGTIEASLTTVACGGVQENANTSPVSQMRYMYPVRLAEMNHHRGEILHIRTGLTAHADI
eukprot:5234316-Pleurochrysis_carterae.AAC.11